MAESIQRVLTRRALSGQHPKTPQEIIHWLEAAAREPAPARLYAIAAPYSSNGVQHTN
jgi:hypothetical protein